MQILEADVVIIGASASGLMCALEAGKRGRRVIVLDHANKAGKKILMSGGGRCNFTNLDVSAENYLSQNPHFCKSALSRFTQWDFIAKVNDHNIAYHERDHGQLFCDDSAKDILNLLLDECAQAKVHIRLNTCIDEIQRSEDGRFFINTHQEKFSLKTSASSSSTDQFQAPALVIATGGLSIPTMGASPFGYQLAEKFGHHIHPVSAGLVPFTLQPEDKQKFSPLSGIAVDVEINNTPQHGQAAISFRENMLFTHRGLSGPTALQISNYWFAGESLQINFLPNEDVQSLLLQKRQAGQKHKLKNLLYDHLPQRLIQSLLKPDLLEQSLQNLSNKQIELISESVHHFTIKPNGTEGYRTAEVTRGGVDCDQLSSKTMESKLTPGLFFIGEVVDVTGWLGGYNFQWAWASGWCAGQAV